MTNAQSPPEIIRSFIDRLRALDAAGRAQLKRNAGRSLAEAQGAYPVFFAILPHAVQLPWEQELYFLAATLFAFGTHRDDLIPARPPRNLGASLGLERLNRSRAGQATTSLDRRFGALVEADREQLPFRLRQAVSLLRAREIPIDWARLLNDLRGWHWDDKSVQLAWSRAYFTMTPDSNDAAGDV